ncbi:MAG: cytochrome C [Betaproteobacteria bacterium]|nr:cytochrome C [Betaproteobacteria bacterium]
MVGLFLSMALAAPALAQQVTYRKDIRPLWGAKCSACHGPDAPYLGEFSENKDKYKAIGKGPRMDTYADLLFFIAWPDTGAIMRRLDDGKNAKDGKPGNMYSTLGATEAERQKNLARFKEWIGKDAWTLKRRDAITKDELARIQAKY